jgi:RNA polymerase sigma-70 factor (ECF subfamily)
MPDSLLLQARAGDRLAFAELVRAYQGSVYSIGLRMLSRRDAAEDLARMSSCSCIASSIPSSRSNTGILAAACGLEPRHRLAAARAERRTQPLDEERRSPRRSPTDDPLMSRELIRLLGELAPPARAVMLLRYQEDRDVAEIGAMLDMPVNTVKSHIKRSLTALRGRMIGAKLIDCEELS